MAGRRGAGTGGSRKVLGRAARSAKRQADNLSEDESAQNTGKAQDAEKTAEMTKKPAKRGRPAKSKEPQQPDGPDSPVFLSSRGVCSPADDIPVMPAVKKTTKKERLTSVEDPTDQDISEEEAVETGDESELNSSDEAEVKAARKTIAKYNKRQLKRELDLSQQSQAIASPARVAEDDDYIESDSKDATPLDVTVGEEMVQDNQNFDMTTPSKDLFKEGKEEDLCRMWCEERHLYVAGAPGYRDATLRDSTIKRIACILQIRPRAVTTRMTSLRTQFTKLSRQQASGSAREEFTDRQNEILRLCAFLRGTSQTKPSFNTYTGMSDPQATDDDVEETPRKATRLSTPKPKQRNVMTAKAARALRLSPVNPVSVDLTLSDSTDEVQSVKPKVAKPVVQRSAPPQRKTASKKEVLAREITDIDDTHDEASDFSVRRSPRGKLVPTEKEESMQASTSQAGLKKKSGPDSKKKSSVGRAKEDVEAEKVKKPFITYPAKAVVKEKKYPVEYTKVDNMEWYEKQGAGYRKAGEKKAATEKKQVTDILLQKTEEMRKVTSGLSDIGREMVQRCAQEEECEDTKWVKTLVPYLKQITAAQKRRFMLKVLMELFDLVEEGKD